MKILQVLTRLYLSKEQQDSKKRTKASSPTIVDDVGGEPTHQSNKCVHPHVQESTWGMCDFRMAHGVSRMN
jgi:hypothetical protein